MTISRLILLFVASSMLAWFAGAGEPDPPIPPARNEGKAGAELTQDEQILKQAEMPTDSAGLLEYFRRRIPSGAEQKRLQQCASQLGSDAYAARVKATDELIRAGRSSLPWLRKTLKSPDAEVVRRAQYCIRTIEENTRQSLSATASRVLAERQVSGALEVVLAYLPFVDEIWVEEEIRQSLKRMATTEPASSTILDRALSDADAKRRAAAAWIVGQCDDAERRQRVIPRLEDEAIEVRFHAASALLTAREPVAVPALIRLLSEGNPDLAWRAEDLLTRLAGQSGPAVWLDAASDNNGRKVRDAWESWWHVAATKIDWKSVRIDQQILNYTVVVENQRSDGLGRVYECNTAGEIRWELRMQNPVDVQWLTGGRMLVADSRSSQVYEVDTRGMIGWKHTGIAPTSCQRLPSGNTLVSTYNSIIEISREGRTVFTYATQGHTYHARKLADGHCVWIDACGEVSEIDGMGKLIAKTNVGGSLTWGSVERLRNGNYLVALGGINKVREIDLKGKVFWEKSVNNPNRTIRLTNGHILVASHGDQCIYEFDSQGVECWKHPCVGKPFAVQRR